MNIHKATENTEAALKELGPEFKVRAFEDEEDFCCNDGRIHITLFQRHSDAAAMKSLLLRFAALIANRPQRAVE